MGWTKGSKDTPEATREFIALLLAERARNGQLKRGTAVAAAAKYGCCRQRAQALVKEDVQQPV